MPPIKTSSLANLARANPRTARNAAWHPDACGDFKSEPKVGFGAWQEGGLAGYSASIAARVTQAARLLSLEQRLTTYEEKLRALAEPGAVTFPVATFAPEPYALKQPFSIVVLRQPEGFSASFVDANINSSGDTQQEAFANTKELILDTFDRLNSLPATKLGPGPKRQLAVLREFIVHVPTNNQAGRPEDRQET